MKKYVRIISEILLIGLLIYLLRKVDFREVYGIVSKMDALWLVLAILSTAIALAIFNIRSMYSMSHIKKTSFWFSMQTMLAGSFVDVITPGARVGGDPVRAYFLGKRYKKSKTKIFGALVADKIFQFIASASFVIFSIFYLFKKVDISYELKVIIFSFLFVFTIIFSLIIAFNFGSKRWDLIAVLRKIKWLRPKIKNGKKEWRHKLFEILLKYLGNFTRSFRRVLTDKKKIFIGLILSLVHWVLLISTSYFLFLASGVNVNFFHVIVAFNMAALIGDVSPTPGGMALIEGVMVLIYSIFGVNIALALTVALISRLIFYFFAILIGGLILLHLERKYNNVH